MKKFTVIERVVFHYFWHVRAESEEEARHMIERMSDGESFAQDEIERDVEKVRKGWVKG